MKVAINIGPSAYKDTALRNGLIFAANQSVSISGKTILFSFFIFWTSDIIGYFLGYFLPVFTNKISCYLNWSLPRLPQSMAAIINHEAAPYIPFLQYSKGILPTLPIVGALQGH